MATNKKIINLAIKILKDNGYNVIPPELSVGDKVMELFKVFWNCYGKKVDKERTIRHWKRMTMKERHNAISFIPTYTRTITDKKYQKNPLTYLNARLWDDGNDYLTEEKAKEQEVQSSSISKQIEELKSTGPTERIDLKREMETKRFIDMISIYERNNHSLCAKPLLHAYETGILKKLGITWEPKNTTKTIL